MAHSELRDPPTTPLGSYAPVPRRTDACFQSFYVPARDGVPLAVDVILPKNLPPDDKIPAILFQTRYWRLMELAAPFKWFIRPDRISPRFKKLLPFFLSHGYALVLADVRGTGASLGVWEYPWAAESIADACAIVDWIIAQPWSNGRVGGTGVSYVGTTAELLTVSNHPAVKCVIPMFNHPDAYADIAFPGGVFNRRFIQDWGKMDWTLDQNRIPPEFGFLGQWMIKGVKPVDGQRGLLPKAIQAHTQNGNAFEIARLATFRDQHVSGQIVTLDDITVHKYKADVESSHVAVFGWGSWMDAGTADAVLRRFMTFKNAGHGIIGAWEHGGNLNASPYRTPDAPVSPSLSIQFHEMLRFFDGYLKDVDNGVQAERVLHYYTLGEERWHSTDRWPPPGTTMQRWYFGDRRTLSTSVPLDEQGADNYPVDFEASTGDLNRWWEMGGILHKAVTYSHRLEAAQHLLAFMSAPLEEDMEITGYPVVTLYVTSTESDGAFIVYLEDVDEQRRVTYVTEGQLRALHRKVSSAPAPYNVIVPYHTFKQQDAQPLVPGEIAKLEFGLNPISVLIRRGHRIRIGLAGHDKGTFARIPETGTPTLTVARNRDYASCIDLPVQSKIR